MKSILFIYNGSTKNQGKVGVSGGSIRLFEIIKNTQPGLVNILTTLNGKDSLKHFNILYSKIFIINYVLKDTILSQLIILIKSFFNLPKNIKFFKNGIVYSSCEHLYDVLPALKLKFFNKCEWYVVYHWVEDYPWRDKRGKTPFLRRYAYWLSRSFSGFLIKIFADKIFAVSDQTKEKLIKIKNIKEDKIRAVYCGVNYEEETKIGEKYKKEKESSYDAVYMKRLNNGKGIFDLLEIWKLCCKNNNNLKFGIIGDGSEGIIRKIKDFINKNNLNNNIFLLGVIYNFEKKFKILNSSKLFILPSHEENWAIVIGEAMAIKLPVIVYDLKEIRPIWGDNVEWVEFGNINEFSNKILDYLSNKEKRELLAQKAYKFIKKYDWKEIAEKEFDGII